MEAGRHTDSHFNSVNSYFVNDGNSSPVFFFKNLALMIRKKEIETISCCKFVSKNCSLDLVDDKKTTHIVND